MSGFHRTARRYRSLETVVWLFALFLSLFFMGIGVTVFDRDKFAIIEVAIGIVFGLAGLFVFAMCIRGAWPLLNGSSYYVFSIDENTIEWGYLGREQTLPVSELKEIYWNDLDGLTVVLKKNDGSKIRPPYIDGLITRRSQDEFLSYMRHEHPEIPITGSSPVDENI